jgi:hypothetical protein
VANQPRGVGILHQPGDRRNRPRHPDPNRSGFADLLFYTRYESGNRLYRRAVISRGRRDAPAGANHAKAVKSCRFDLGATKIDAYAESRCHRLCTFIAAKQERGYGLLSSILYNPAA